jgi:hypothetical protein
MTHRHVAFGAKRNTMKASDDPNPHTLTLDDEAYILRTLERGGAVRTTMVRKLLRLYKERTAAGQLLIRELEKVLADPELW